MVFPSDYFQMMLWINIHVCFPLTFLVIPLSFMVRLDHIPVSYYINLLISNLIPIISLVYNGRFSSPYSYNDYYYYDPFMHRVFLPYVCAGVASSCFRMIFAVERFLFLYRPQIHFMRKTKGFVTFCVLGWILCIVLCSILISFPDLAGLISLIFSAIMFIICLAVTLKSLCVASSESAEENCRVGGALVLLLVNYIFFILSMIGFLINTFFTLSLHCPVLDFLLLGFMSKGPFIRLLLRLCCCRKTNPAENDSSRSDVGL
uniref:G-protein coupled receptors family 1 profile domain-containing protein n=1 Tax=Poecilia formosa TaxID=48698 RepID=A0A096LR54_POEFO